MGNFWITLPYTIFVNSSYGHSEHKEINLREIGMQNTTIHTVGNLIGEPYIGTIAL